MNFATPVYWFFLLVVYVVYWHLSRRAQHVFLLLASYFFYAQWDWRFLGLILISTIVDYIAGPKIHEARTLRAKKTWLWLSLTVNLGILGYFKYFNFFASSFVDLASSLGFGVSYTTLHIILPVGISFYTFQTLSYTIDIYKGELKPTKSFIDFATFVAFFPQLVAGPIVRAKQFTYQLEERNKFSFRDIEYGLFRILTGLFKKVFVGDTIAKYIVDPVFADPGSYSAGVLWFALLGFAAQLYADFSGYSNIAIGSARLLGFRIPENFNIPYISRNISEFWRRWHITMSTWFRDYVYFALGGNRKGFTRTNFNLAVTVFLAGLWHGASWPFVLHGLAHGIFLSTHQIWRRFKKRYGLERERPRWYNILPAWALTMLCYGVGIVLFRAWDMPTTAAYFKGMISSAGTTASLDVPLLAWIGMVSVLLDHLVVWWIQKYPDRAQRVPVAAQSMMAVAAVIFIYYAIPEGVNPFIYFQF